MTDLGGEQYQVRFSIAAPPGTRTVHLAGSFNGWDPQALAMEGPDGDGSFEITRVLAKGRYEYKFVVDGATWMSDPGNPHRTDGHGNSIAFVGVEPPEGGKTSVPPPPVAMARIGDHPKDVLRLAERLKTAKSAGEDWTPAHWLEKHSMPLFSSDAVSFVFSDAKAERVVLYLYAHGARMGYDVPPLVAESGVFAISLAKSELPERTAYAYEVTRNGEAEIVQDPRAWSMTSRAGRPAAAVVESSKTRGRIEVIPDVGAAQGMLQSRDIYVYLPPGYDETTDRRYPVLYMHDGQNCWDDPTEPFGHGGWCVNLTADRLIEAGEIVPFIGVGIANTPQRLTEYGPGPNVLSDKDHAYIQFLRRKVKPLIDRRYRTLPDAKATALMGSSMGGIISFQASLLNPGVFGQAACLSPAFFFEDSEGRDYFDLVRRAGKQPVRLYLDSGTAGRGNDGAPRTREMVALLRETGWRDGEDLMHFEDTGAEHNERAWRARLDRPLAFLFGRNDGRATPEE